MSLCSDKKMPLQPGGKLRHYAVVPLLGQGKMGEVYRAKDTKLKRDAGIQVPPIRIVKPRSGAVNTLGYEVPCRWQKVMIWSHFSGPKWHLSEQAAGVYDARIGNCTG